ncbi:MAG: hypothetical protein GQ559_07955 [Desulfobulbaceae bacterium]|nr:hypothetical protein [Desulfobulbaceae bacterium]
MASLHETSQSSFDSLELIPGSSLTLPANFDFSGKREQYNAGSLYEKINGKAPLYLEAGFTTLTTQRFMHREDPSQWFEFFVYDMGTELNAFSVYSTQRRPGAEIISSLEPFDHYKTENGLYLRHGVYYIECIGSSSSVQLDEAMIAIGRDLLSADPGSGATITELQLFPDENLVPGSFKLTLNSAFGSEALHNTFIAKYDLNDQLVTAFISTQGTPEQAKQTAEGYYQFLVDDGGLPDNSVNSMQLVDFYGLTEIVFTVGPFVVGIHEGESRVDALEIGERLRASITKTLEN